MNKMTASLGRETLISWFDGILDSEGATHPDRVKAYKNWIRNLEDPTFVSDVSKHADFVRRLRLRIGELNQAAGV